MSSGTINPTLEAFEKQTGIKVDYVTDVNDNHEFFGIVRNQLADCQSTGRDMFVLTDYMAGRMVDLGWIQKLDKSKIPNVTANAASQPTGEPGSWRPTSAWNKTTAMVDSKAK